MIRRFYLFLFAIILFITPLFGFAEEENLVELDIEGRKWLEYRCSLPDGGLILTGGMVLYGAGKNKGAYVVCLNANRTIRWEYADYEKDGYTSAEEATVLADGTIAVVVWDYPRKIAVQFFTPQGESAGEKLDLTEQCGNSGQIYDITPSFILKFDYIGDLSDPEDDRYETTLYNWQGEEITRYNGLIVYGGYGFSIPGSENLVTYGQDTVNNSHAKIAKISWPQGGALWETVLDYQQPETEAAELEQLAEAEDGGYVGWLQEAKPAADSDAYVFTYYLVRFDPEGRLLWIRNTESLPASVGWSNLFSYDGKIVMQCESEEDDSWSKGEPVRFLWTDQAGKELGTTELTLRPEDFRLMRERQIPEEEGVYRFPLFVINRMIRMEDGLWTFATFWIAEKQDGDNAILFPPDDQEFVMIRIPEVK